MPVSSASSRPKPVGAMGALESMVMDRLDENVDKLPAASLDFAVME